ncbi:MAG: nucleotidyltransferase domain-containing protein [Candidatus Hydrogenedentes bacterium]|nr:nucleotidyltransferase domain-containing protein [Candidatus Hydrogenedentota bacterium]
MHNTVIENQKSILSLCRQYHVKQLDLFGSALSDAFDTESSDIDLLVEFLPLPSGRRADAYFGLLEQLETLLQRPIDLVCVRAVRNPYFLDAIRVNRSTLYAA